MSGAYGAVLGATLTVCALPALVASSYLGVLALFSRRPRAGRIAGSGERCRFDVIVPAHDEAAGIATTVRNLLSLAYPRDRYRVLVVADNCTDRTAEVAGDAGARVVVRQDASRRGKGYALAHAFAISRDEGFADAMVVVDADTLASSNLLTAMATRFEAGDEALQVRYGVRNRADSWRTRLMTIAFAMYHEVRSLGRERLDLSCGLRGNGMAFSRGVLEHVPYGAFSVVEDVEYGLELGRAGVRIAYVHDALVEGEMPSGERASRTQRERWESGRSTLARKHALPTLRVGLAHRDARQVDLAVDLLVPPLSRLATVVLLGVTASAFAVLSGVAFADPAIVLWSASAAMLALYVARGCVLSGVGVRALVDLCWAPVYVAWKFARRARSGRERSAEWVRTSRSAES